MAHFNVVKILIFDKNPEDFEEFGELLSEKAKAARSYSYLAVSPVEFDFIEKYTPGRLNNHEYQREILKYSSTYEEKVFLLLSNLSTLDNTLVQEHVTSGNISSKRKSVNLVLRKFNRPKIYKRRKQKSIDLYYHFKRSLLNIAESIPETAISRPIYEIPEIFDSVVDKILSYYSDIIAIGIYGSAQKDFESAHDIDTLLVVDTLDKEQYREMINAFKKPTCCEKPIGVNIMTDKAVRGLFGYLNATSNYIWSSGKEYVPVHTPSEDFSKTISAGHLYSLRRAMGWMYPYAKKYANQEALVEYVLKLPYWVQHFLGEEGISKPDTRVSSPRELRKKLFSANYTAYKAILDNFDSKE